MAREFPFKVVGIGQRFFISDDSDGRSYVRVMYEDGVNAQSVTEADIQRKLQPEDRVWVVGLDD